MSSNGRYFLYRLALKPKEIVRHEADRAWGVVVQELEAKLGLNKRRSANKMMTDRKQVQGYLIEDFNVPFSSEQATLLAPEYLVRPNDKIYIKLMPLPAQRTYASRAQPVAAAAEANLSEEERLRRLQNPHTTSVRPRFSPYARPEHRLTGIPRSMQATQYRQLYGADMPKADNKH